jgi:hypothetical protein
VKTAQPCQEHGFSLFGGGAGAIDAPRGQPLLEVRYVIADRSAHPVPRWTRGAATDMAAAPIGAQECDRNPEMGSGGAFVHKKHGMTPLSSI